MRRSLKDAAVAAVARNPGASSAAVLTVAAMVLAARYPPPRGLPNSLPLDAVLVVSLGAIGFATWMLPSRRPLPLLDRRWPMVVAICLVVAAGAAVTYAVAVSRNSVYFAADGRRYAIGALRPDDLATGERTACLQLPASGIVESEEQQLIDCAQGDASRFWTAASVVLNWVLFHLLHLLWLGALLVPAVLASTRAVRATVRPAVQVFDTQPASTAPRKDVDLGTHVFDVALSYAGEDGDYVAAVASALVAQLGPNRVFFDRYFAGQTARPALDLLLDSLYRQRSRLVVLFIGEHYQRKNWPSLELRSVREKILRRQFDTIMLVRMDDGVVDGIAEGDGYVDARAHGPDIVAGYIAERARVLLARAGEPE